VARARLCRIGGEVRVAAREERVVAAPSHR
jgi:hypothetical protein